MEDFAKIDEIFVKTMLEIEKYYKTLKKHDKLRVE